MDKSRYDLDKILRDILGSDNVYFSPPDGMRMNYPCVVYHLSSIRTVKADNKKYLKIPRYTITLIDEDPDSIYMEPLLDLPHCSMDNVFTYDNLNHFVYTLEF